MSPIPQPKNLFAQHSLREIFLITCSTLVGIVQFLLLVLLAPILLVLQICFMLSAVVYVFFRSQAAFLWSRIVRKYQVLTKKRLKDALKAEEDAERELLTLERAELYNAPVLCEDVLNFIKLKNDILDREEDYPKQKKEPLTASELAQKMKDGSKRFPKK